MKGSERTQGDERGEKTRGNSFHLAPLLQTAPRNETRDPPKVSNSGSTIEAHLDGGKHNTPHHTKAKERGEQDTNQRENLMLDRRSRARFVAGVVVVERQARLGR
jgi:hypothetical protein